MNWPDPGTPPDGGHDADRADAPSGSTEAADAPSDVPTPGASPPASDAPWLTERDLASSPRPWEEERPRPGADPVPAEPPIDTPTYAQLRSEADRQLGRWEHEGPVPPGSSTPDGSVSPDNVHGDLMGGPPDGAQDAAPAGTHEVAVSDAETAGEGPGPSRHVNGLEESSSTAARELPDLAPSDPAAPFHGEHREETEAPAEGPPAEPPRAGSAAVIEEALADLAPDDRHATVLCVANQKGGVGKTTTTVSLGAALAMEGAQVLVVDLDPQGNATTGLGLRAQEGAPSTYRVIVEQMDVEDAAEPTAVRGLHVLPSSLDLAGAEIELVPAFSRENRLKQALDAVRDLYDVILIDCPPSLGLLTINALVAADQVLVPIQCEYYALEGLGQLMRTVKLVADSLNRDLAVGGVVLTMFDGRTNLSQQVVDEVRGYFGDVAYQTVVPRTVRLSEAPSYGQPIGVFDANSRGARAYQRLAREVARRLDLDLGDEDISPLDRLLGGPATPPEDAGPLPTDLVPEDVPSPSEAEAPVEDDPGTEDAGEVFHGEHQGPSSEESRVQEHHEHHEPEHREHHEPEHREHRDHAGQHHEPEHHEHHEPEHHEPEHRGHHEAEHHEHRDHAGQHHEPEHREHHEPEHHEPEHHEPEHHEHHEHHEPEHHEHHEPEHHEPEQGHDHGHHDQHDQHGEHHW